MKTKSSNPQIVNEIKDDSEEILVLIQTFEDTLQELQIEAEMKK